MPIAFVSIREGRPPETIRTMISAVTRAIAESLDALLLSEGGGRPDWDRDAAGSRIGHESCA